MLRLRLCTERKNRPRNKSEVNTKQSNKRVSGPSSDSVFSKAIFCQLPAGDTNRTQKWPVACRQPDRSVHELKQLAGNMEMKPSTVRNVCRNDGGIMSHAGTDFSPIGLRYNNSTYRL